MAVPGVDVLQHVAETMPHGGEDSPRPKRSTSECEGLEPSLRMAKLCIKCTCCLGLAHLRVWTAGVGVAHCLCCFCLSLCCAQSSPHLLILGFNGCQKERERGEERDKRESGLASTFCTPLSVSSPLFLLLIRCLHGTVLLVMVGLDHMAVGMDVDVAGGVESRKYAPMSNGSARSAVLGTGGVVRIAGTVRVSRTTMRMLRRPRHRRKSMSWRRG